MPLYEYKCDNCDDVFEVLQKFSDEPVAIHEKCGGPVHKLISRSSLQFKGTGWYITDYARAGAKSDANGSDKSESKGEAKSESNSESKSDSKSESKSESKPESKSEAKTESKSDTSSSTKSTTESTTKN
jgi:putative FmdB family regulatory protein